MEKRHHILFKTILCCILLSALISGCRSPGVENNSPERFLAQISGEVIITKYITLMRETYIPAVDALWVVTIKFTNGLNEFQDISDYAHWSILAGDTYYGIPEILKMDNPHLLTVPAGQTVEKLVCFQVPASLSPGSCRLAYQAQKQISFGQLTGGQMVEGYDWDNKVVIEKQ